MQSASHATSDCNPEMRKSGVSRKAPGNGKAVYQEDPKEDALPQEVIEDNQVIEDEDIVEDNNFIEEENIPSHDKLSQSENDEAHPASTFKGGYFLRRKSTEEKKGSPATDEVSQELLTNVVQERQRTSLREHLLGRKQRHARHTQVYPSELPLEHHSQPISFGIKLLLKMAFVAGLVVSLGICFLLFSQWQTAKSPYANLRAFAVSEIVNKDLQSIQELAADDLSLYAQAACVEGKSAEIVRRALFIQLNNLPKEVREEVVTRAVIDGVSSKNSLQNTTASLTQDGMAFSYLAFWSTAFNGDNAIMSAKYSTCVMVAGVKLLIGEDLAGFDTSTYKRQIGTKPCQCGYLSCEKCPIFEDVTARMPIFKRHKMTLRNQVDLHRWMAKQAVDRAISLVDNSRSLPAAGSTSFQAIAWRNPNENVFTGDDNSAPDEL